MKDRSNEKKPPSSKPLRLVSLFAGYGAFDLGLERAGMKCIAQVERDKHCLKVLAKHWPDVPRFTDVRDFPPKKLEKEWRRNIKGKEAQGEALVDVVCGGFP